MFLICIILGCNARLVRLPSFGELLLRHPSNILHILFTYIMYMLILG